MYLVLFQVSQMNLQGDFNAKRDFKTNIKTQINYKNNLRIHPLRIKHLTAFYVVATFLRVLALRYVLPIVSY